MATPPDEVRSGLQVVTTAATAQVALSAGQVAPKDTLDALSAVLPLLVPGYYDAAGTLATSWYADLRQEATPRVEYVPEIVSTANTDWIERELRIQFDRISREVEAEVEAVAARVVSEAEALVQKEVARGFRDTIDGNVKRDREAIGWSRHTRPGACKFCLMLARDSVVYHTAKTARFAAHTDCHCVARPEFANGQHGPEASVFQYLGQQRERTDEERAALRDYLNGKYPDAPG